MQQERGAHTVIHVFIQFLNEVIICISQDYEFTDSFDIISLVTASAKIHPSV